MPDIPIDDIDPDFPVDPEIPDIEQPIPVPPPVEYPQGYEPDAFPEDVTDPTYEEALPEIELPVELPPVDDGKVDAEGTVWRLHYLPGTTPTEEEMRNLTGSVKATIVVEPGENLSRITPQ